MRAACSCSPLVLGLAALGAAGCSEYKYYDISRAVRRRVGSSTSNNVSTVQTCHVIVTGADSADFYLNRELLGRHPPGGAQHRRLRVLDLRRFRAR